MASGGMAVSYTHLDVYKRQEIKLFPFLKFRQNLGINYTNRERGTYYGRRTSEGSEANNINGKAGQSTNWSMGITAE